MKERIAFLINNMSHGGGTERVTSMIANGLCDDYCIYIISCNEGYETRYKLNNNVSVISLNGEKIANSVKRKIVNCNKITRIIEDNSIGMIVCVDLDMYLYCVKYNIFKKYKDVKVIAWEHFNYYYHKGLKGYIVRTLSARCADCLVVLGKNDLFNYTKNIDKIKNVRCIYNPIAKCRNEASELNNKNVLAIGRLEYQKGFDMLLEAWKYVEEKNDEWRLDIYGEGSLRSELELYIKENCIKRAQIHDYANDVDQLYVNTSLYVLSSRYEGFGLVLLEAQAHGLPIVSFECREGPAEIVKDGVNGYLVKDGNVRLLANKMLELMDDDNKRKKFAKHAKDDLHRFDYDEVCEKWKELLSQIREGT